MFCNLYRIETYGMKNIHNLITIDFCPLTVDKESKKQVTKVKSIYGTNGVGKSAIINSIALFQQLTLDTSVLKQNNEIIKLNKMINKLKKKFFISVVYGVKNYLYEKDTIYKSEITLVIENDIPYIKGEKFYILKDQTINGNYQLLYEVLDGNLIISNNSDLEMNIYFKNRTMNILKYSSCTSILRENDVVKEIINYFENDKNSVDRLGVIYYLIINRLFVEKISIFLDSMDIHTEYDDYLLEEILNSKLNVDNISIIRNTIKSKKDIIPKTKIEEYKNNVKRLTDFLRLFKPELKNIKLDISEDENYFYCTKKMVYDGYEVDSDYESTGIQKLMNIYNSIEDVTEGKIVFIDELDANISGIYLKSLIEYLNNINKGQLCFTCHNHYPMEYLYKYSNAIDFMGETGKLISWKKNGHYKPYNQYPEGLIVDSPFNIDSIDFMKVFEQ